MSAIEFSDVLPGGWSRARGFSYAVSAKGTRVVSVSGQVARVQGSGGVDAALRFGQQWSLALGNVVHLVQAAGGEAANIIALRIYVTDMEAYRNAGEELGDAWREHMGKHFPASTLVQVLSLVDPHAMVEIEAQALLP